MFSPFKLPGVVATAIKNMGDMTGPLSMIIIGAALGEANLKDALDIDAFKLTLVRLVVQPLIYLIILRAAGVQDILWQVVVVLTAMPAAANTEIIAEKYGKDYKYKIENRNILERSKNFFMDINIKSELEELRGLVQNVQDSL